MAPTHAIWSSQSAQPFPVPRERSLKVAYLSSYMLVSGVPVTFPKTEDSLTIRLTLPLDQERTDSWRLVAVAAALIVVPVFLQAPWVRLQPFSAAVFTACLLGVALRLEQHGRGSWRQIGLLLVGFSGSWLGGCLFWGWFRLHPLLHLPIEAFALPLAIAGLRGRWHLAACFYLASLLGTACTDAAMALTGVMPFWPLVLNASLADAPLLLAEAARQVLHPFALLVVAGFAAGLMALGRRLAAEDSAGRVAAAALVMTLAVDGLFLMAALLAPQFSGLI